MEIAIGKVNLPELTGAGVFTARNLAVLSMPGSGLHSGFGTLPGIGGKDEFD